MPKLPESIALRWQQIVRALPIFSGHAKQTSHQSSFASPPVASGSVVRPIVVAGLLHLAMQVGYLVPFHFDVSAFVCASEDRIGKHPFEAITVGFPTGGCDGQCYYVIALNPFAPQAEHVDDICLRRARLLYPLACFLLSGGDPRLLLWVMPLLNLLATMATTWLGAKIALHYGRSSWWGLLLPAAVNVLTSGLRNFTDPMSMTATVGLLAAWSLRWPTWSLIAWGAGCVLGREQNIVIVGIVFGEAILTREFRRAGALAVVSAIWGAWLLTLKELHGKLPFAVHNVSSPFEGIWYGWTHLGVGTHQARNPIPHFLRMLFFTLQSLLCITILPRGNRIAGLIGLAGAGLAVIGSVDLYDDEWCYMRQINWVPLAVWLWTIESGRRWPVWLLLSGILWPIIELRFRLSGGSLNLGLPSSIF